MLFLQYEQVEDAPCAAVAVVKRVDAFKLVVGDGHAQDGVECVVGVDELDELVHELLDEGGVLWWLVDGLACGLVFEHGAGKFAQPCVVLFDLFLDFEDGGQAD